MKLVVLQKFFRNIFGSNHYELKAFPVPGTEKKPFAVVCPGGGYACVVSIKEGDFYAQALNKQGYPAFVLRYRTRRKGRFPAPLDDLAQAIRDIRANSEQWNIDTEHYSVWGCSAGGHLAACFGTQLMGYAQYKLPKPDTIILSYPVITMGKDTHLGSRNNLIGKHPTNAQIAMTSVEQHITSEYPPTFLWNSCTDAVVAPANSQLIANALKQSGVKYLHHEFQTGEHGCGLAIGTECEPWFMEAVNFWKMTNNTLK